MLGAAGPVNGLFDTDAEVFVAVTGVADGEAEIRSLTFMVCGPEPTAAESPTGVIILDVIAGSAGFAADETVDIGIAEVGDDIFSDSTFFSVSSTSAATQPAPVSVVFMASRETPSFICEFI